MKVYKYYIVYNMIITKGDKAKIIPASIELDLYDKITMTDPISQMIKEINMSKFEDKDIDMGIVIYNWKLLSEYEVEDEEKKKGQ